MTPVLAIDQPLIENRPAVNARPIPLLPLCVLIMLIGMTYWLSRFVQIDEIRADAKLRHDPDLVIENFSALKLGEHGGVEYTVRASKMSHYRDDDSSILDTVVFTAVQPNHPKVTATAPRGQLIKHADGADEVMMDGGVLLETEPNEKFPAMKLTTPKLTLIPDENIARSSDGVSIESPTGILTAKTMLLNTLTRRMTLELVDLTYAPRRKQ